MSIAAATPDLELLTYGQVAEILGVSKCHVQRMAWEEEIAVIHLGARMKRISRADLLAYLERRRQPAAAEITRERDRGN